MNLFIAIEGSDGCGKSTQINLLKKRLENQAHFTKEPGSSHIATCEAIRKVLLDTNNEISPTTEAMLYASDRHEHLTRVKEWLKDKHVITDRSIFSSLAYQPSHETISLEKVADINKYNMELLMPDLVIYLELSNEERMKRIATRNEELNRLELNNLEFFERVNENYPLAFAYAEEVVVIDASQSIEEIHEEIIKILQERNVL